MKKRLLAGLLALCMLFGMTGCGEEESAASALSSQSSIPEPTFGVDPEEAAVAAQVQTPSAPGEFSMPCNSGYGWDPYSSVSMENRAVMQLIYQGLFTQTPDFETEPVLVREFDVSEDGLTWTITLQNAWFSNGDKVEPADVIYSFAKARSSALYSARFRDVGSYEVTAADTLIIHMNQPNDRLPALLDFPIVPDLSAAEGPVGTGPFVREGNALILDQNWWQGAENVQFDRVNLYASVSAEDTRDNFEIDNVHFVYNDPMASSAATFHCDYELWNSRNTVMQYIGFNLSDGACQDQRIRAAIIRAIDRSEIAETVYHNFADPAALPVAPTSSMYSQELAKEYDYSADEALEILLGCGSFYLPPDHPIRQKGPGATETVPEEDSLLEDALEEPLEEAPEDEASEDDFNEDPAAGGETGEDGENEDETGGEEGYNHLTLLVMAGNTCRTESARLAKKHLEDVGFTVEVQVLEQDEFIYTINTGEYDLYYADVCLTPDFDLRSLLYPGESLNYSYIQEDADLRSLYDSALENSGNRYDLYQYIMDQGYLCPVLFQNNAVFTTRGVFTGLDPAPGNAFYQVENIVVQ